jgi:hypothetical protein
VGLTILILNLFTEGRGKRPLSCDREGSERVYERVYSLGEWRKRGKKVTHIEKKGKRRKKEKEERERKRRKKKEREER